MANKLISALTVGDNTGVFGLPYATTTQEAGTFTATVQNNAPFVLEEGAQVLVKFCTSIHGSMSLNVNNTGSINLAGGYLSYREPGICLCVYDGVFWVVKYSVPELWSFTNRIVYDTDGQGWFSLSKDGISADPQAMSDGSWPTYDLTFPETTGTLIADTTLANGSTAGAVKTTSTVTSSNGYTACPVIDGVPYYKDTKVKVMTETTTRATLLAVDTTEYSSGSATDKIITDTGVYLDTTAGKLTATEFAGSGASLTSLNASNLSDGIVPSACIPAATDTTLGGVKLSFDEETQTLYISV